MTGTRKFAIAMPRSGHATETFTGMTIGTRSFRFNTFSLHNIRRCILHNVLTLLTYDCVYVFSQVKSFLHLNELQEKLPASHTYFELHTLSSNILVLFVVTVGAEYFILPPPLV